MWCMYLPGTIFNSVANPGCLLRIPDPNFSIPDPGSTRSRIQIRIEELSIFNPTVKVKTVSKLSEKWSRIRIFFSIPEPGSGSATLIFNNSFLYLVFLSGWGKISRGESLATAFSGQTCPPPPPPHLSFSKRTDSVEPSYLPRILCGVATWMERNTALLVSFGK